MKQKGYWLLWAVCVVLAAAVLWRLRTAYPTPEPEDKIRQQIQSLPGGIPQTVEADPEEPYVSPIDFEQLWQQNREIVAWLDIPDTKISYPVLRSETDNGFYLNHDAAKRSYAGGALFVEDYNCRELTDPVTVIYGHRMGMGQFFGSLQQNYETEEAFGAHRQIYLYLPDRLEAYQAVAAVPYSKNHILYNYDFSKELEHYRFFDRAFTVHSISAQMDMEEYPEFGEKVLILSTCYAGNRNNRYLVIAKEVNPE